MTNDRLEELLEIANVLLSLEEAEEEYKASGEWKEAKEQFEALQTKFDTLKNEYVDALLESEDEGSAGLERGTSEIEELRASCDPSWHPALDYTAEKVLPHLRKEASKSPLRRKATKALPYALAAVAVLGFFGTRLVQANDISAPFDSRTGLEQRATAVTKLLRYDDWMGTHVRRGGWFKGIMLWPIEPTETEISGAKEFVGLALEAQDFAVSSHGCIPVMVGYENELSDDEMEFVAEVAKRVEEPGVEWQEPAVLTVAEAARHVGGC